MKIIEIDKMHLLKWESLKKYIELKPNVNCYAVHDNFDCCSIMITDSNRIVHIYTHPEARRCGYATALVRHYTNNIKKGSKDVIAIIEPNNYPAMSLLLKQEFTIQGFEVTWGDKRYVLSNRPWRTDVIDPDKDIKDDLAECVKHMYITETTPVKLSI